MNGINHQEVEGEGEIPTVDNDAKKPEVAPEESEYNEEKDLKTKAKKRLGRR